MTAGAHRAPLQWKRELLLRWLSFRGMSDPEIHTETLLPLADSCRSVANGVLFQE